MSYKLDIFKVLRKISDGDLSFFDTLSEEELKEFNPYFLQMWLKNPDNNFDDRTRLINEILNPYILSLSAHKKLLYQLMCVSHGFGISTRYKLSKSNKSPPRKHIKAIMDYYQCSETEALDYDSILENSDIVEICEKLGYDDSELREIFNEIDRKK